MTKTKSKNIKSHFQPFLEKQDQKQEKQTVHFISGVILLIAIIMLIMNIIHDKPFLIIFSSSYVVMAFLSIAYYHRIRNFGHWTSFFLVFSIMVTLVLFYTGGTKGAGVLWAFVFPSLAFHLKNYNRAVVYAGSLFLMLLFLFVVSPPGFYPNHFDPLFVSIYLFIFMGLISFHYASAKRRDNSNRLMQESSERFYALFNHISMGVALIDPKLHVIEANEIMRKWFPGIEKSTHPYCFEIMGEPGFQKPCKDCQVTKSLADGKVHTIEKKRILGNKLCMARITASPMLDKARRVVAVIETIEDVSDHELTRQALRNSDRIFSQALDMLFILGLDGKFKSLNPSWSRITGWSTQELMSHGFTYFIYADDVEKSLQAFNELSQGSGKLDFENRIRCKSGALRWLSWKSISDVQDEVIYGVVRDITDEKHIALSLRESEQRLNNLISNLPGFVYKCENDHNWTMRFVSEGCKALTGFLPDDFILNQRISFGSRILEEDSKSVWTTWQKVLSEKKQFEGEYRFRKADGSICWFWERGKGVFDTEGKLLYLEGFITDITESKKATEALKMSEMRFRNLFNNNHATMMLIDPDDGSIVDANPAALAFYGYAYEEICKMNISQINTLSREEIRNLMKDASGFKQNRFLFKHRLSNGKVRDVEVFSGKVGFDERTLLYSIVHDVTDARKAEMDLKESEEKFRILSHTATAGIYMYRNNRFVMANPAVTAITGYDESDLINKSLGDVVHPDDIELVNGISFSDSQKFLSNRLEFRIIDANGNTLWIDHASERTLIDQLPTVIGTFFDITVRKQATEALRQSEEKYRLITGNTSDVIWILNLRSLKFTFVSPSIMQLRGITAEEAMQETLDEALTPESAWYVKTQTADIIADFIRTHDSKASQRFTEVFQPCRDGSVIPVEVASHLQFNEAGEIEVVGVSRHIGERKRMEAELARKAGFQQLLADISKSFIDIDSHQLDVVIQEALHRCGVFLQVDRTFLFQPDADGLHISNTHEWCGSGVSCIKTSFQKLNLTALPSLLKIIKAQRSFYIEDIEMISEDSTDEKEMLRKRGTKSLLTLPVVKNNTLLGYLGFETIQEKKSIKDTEMEMMSLIRNIFADTLMKIKLDSLLKENALKLMQSNETKDQLFSIISHDLRSPFTSFIGLTELMADEGVITRMEDMRKHAAQLHNLALGAYDLVDNLLHWSRLQGGKLSPVVKELVVKEFIDGVVESLIPQLEQKFLRFFNLCPNGLTAFFDPNMMEIVVRNLISNAMKFTHSGGKIWIEASCGAQNELLIRVNDSGIGIPAEIIPVLFSMNTNKGRVGLHGERSSGLGLMLCKEFIEKHHGIIRVESNENKGTTFIISLPAKPLQ